MRIGARFGPHAPRDHAMLSSSDPEQFRAVIANPKSPQKHVWRAPIVLLSADCWGPNAIMAPVHASSKR